MSESTEQVLPASPRWTHIALMVDDIDASIAWYTAHTPLELLEKRQDDNGWGAWLGQEAHPDSPFFLVLAEFLPEKNPWAGAPKSVMGPFNHIGIELTSKEDVDERAAAAAEADCLAHGPVQLPAPIGYVAFVNDPDGNTIEFSYGQGIYAKAHELWGDRS